MVDMAMGVEYPPAGYLQNAYGVGVGAPVAVAGHHVVAGSRKEGGHFLHLPQAVPQKEDVAGVRVVGQGLFHDRTGAVAVGKHQKAHKVLFAPLQGRHTPPQNFIWYYMRYGG